MKSGGVDYRIGPGMSSLLMIFVVLCMAALAVLTLMSVQSDSSLNLKSQENTVRYYEAAAQAQRELFELDQRLAAARAEAKGDQAVYATFVQALQAELTLAFPPVGTANEEEDALEGGLAMGDESAMEDGAASDDGGAMEDGTASDDGLAMQEDAPTMPDAETDAVHAGEDAWIVRFTSPINEDRQLEVLLRVSDTLTGSRYTLTSHRVINTKPWEGAENIGQYQKPE